ncbi:hypothetical protein J4G53_23680 [Serratia ureilytica]|uniref:hypothetical protein n=1 Tax=Serratia ureilytica TaxID=300181 RepID=UPI001AA0C793|nr:hypothetical protein [Serratia ureilytica]MBO1811255.1 hypothetical protein [Serratia ureilytica]
MSIKITLDVLFETLMILGHGRVWMEETVFDHFDGYSCYREIRTWDNRVVAWWDDADDAWYLCVEVDVITPVPAGFPYNGGELSEEWCFQLMTTARC